MNRRDILRLLATCGAMAGLDPEVARGAAIMTHSRTGAQPHSSVLDEHQRALIDQLTELIMPATDTPGARDARVVDFVDTIVTSWYHDDERTAFLRGLADVDSRAQADFAKPFLDLTAPQQTAILTGLNAESRAMPPGSPAHFFTRMKGLTLSGYYSSEIAYTQELHGVHMPGRYDGAAPVGAPGTR